MAAPFAERPFVLRAKGICDAQVFSPSGLEPANSNVEEGALLEDRKTGRRNCHSIVTARSFFG
jgi:hypothetical protein